MNRITSIVFDLDGTLYVSSELTDEIQRVAVDFIAFQLRVTTGEAETKLSAAKAELSARTGCEATLSAACDLLKCDIKALHGYLAENIEPEKYLVRDDRVIDMLGRIGKEYALYIYTNNNRSLTDRIMRLLGIDGLFARVFSVEDFWRPKPDRLALAKIFAAIGSEPVECLFVGDRYDVDLKLPEEHGSKVFLIQTVNKLLSLEKSCSKGEWIDD